MDLESPARILPRLSVREVVRVVMVARCATGRSSPAGDVVGVPGTSALAPIVLGIDLLDVRLQLLKSEDLPLVVV